MNQHQEQFELEAIQIAKDRSAEWSAKIDSVSVEFDVEIQQLADLIDAWRQGGRLSVDEKQVAYESLINKIPARVLAEQVMRALLESHLICDSKKPATYQNIVSTHLIQNRLRALLPQEELAIEIQHKYTPIDHLVARTVAYFPQLFIHVKSKEIKISDSIRLTEAAQQRLGKVDIRELIIDVPMFCKPQEWTSVFDGGFLTKELQRTSPLVNSKSHDYRELRNIDRSLQESPDILKAINKLQGVRYRVDPQYAYYQSVIDKNRKATLAAKKEELAIVNAEIAKLEELIKAESETLDPHLLIESPTAL